MINLHTARGTAIGDILRAYRYGELNLAEEVELFQYLINAGIIVHLDSFYGRQASRLIEAGYCKQADMSRFVPVAEQIQNAALTAAAPELLEACLQARAALPDAWAAVRCDVPVEVIDLLNTAILKASGEKNP